MAAEKFNLPKSMMVHFHMAIMESILASSITSWNAAASAKDKGRLKHIIRSAEKVIGCTLPTLQDLYASRTLRPAGKIMVNTSHPRQKLLKHSPPAGGCAPSGPKPQSTRTAPECSRLHQKGTLDPRWHWFLSSPMDTICLWLNALH